MYICFTFTSIWSESLKSRSIASTSASLGALGRNRPNVRCMRCIVRLGQQLRATAKRSIEDVKVQEMRDGPGNIADVASAD